MLFCFVFCFAAGTLSAETLFTIDNFSSFCYREFGVAPSCRVSLLLLWLPFLSGGLHTLQKVVFNNRQQLFNKVISVF